MAVLSLVLLFRVLAWAGPDFLRMPEHAAERRGLVSGNDAIGRHHVTRAARPASHFRKEYQLGIGGKI
jgi:hypothetical protein